MHLDGHLVEQIRWMRCDWHKGCRSKASEGFTIIEALICVLIVLALTALILSAVNRVRGRAQQAACGSNMRQIVFALRMYAADHDGRGWLWGCQDYTDSPAGHPGIVVDVMTPYVAGPDVWFCPSDPWARQPLVTAFPWVPHWKLSYSVCFTAETILDGNPDEVLLVDAATTGRGPLWHFGGYNMAYVDGRVRWHKGDFPSFPPYKPVPWRPEQDSGLRR